MAWITPVAEDQAQGRLAEIYAAVRRSPAFMGQVPNVVKAFSLRPELLDLMSRVATTATFGGSRLGRVREEMIATTVSSLNRCHY
jgi:hypothetical protein